MQHFPIGLDIVWCPQSQYARSDSQQQSRTQNWLVHTGSLTERIQSMCANFDVYVVGQGIAPLYDHEVRALASDGEVYDVREVVLLADNQPWVFARSIIPKALTEGEWQDMGKSPLGKRLFNDNRFTRSEFELGLLPASHFKSLIPLDDPMQQLFARRSTFTFNTYRVLVAEVFLPNAPIYLSGDTPL